MITVCKFASLIQSNTATQYHEFSKGQTCRDVFVRQGAGERATGVYMGVHEDCERDCNAVSRKQIKGMLLILPGDFSKWAPPDPIPNSEVKPFSAYDSVVYPCKSRSSPGSNNETLALQSGGFLLLIEGTMSFLNTEFCDLYYEVHGQGHPLILISGYSTDHAYWMPILDELAQHFKVIIFDNRGSGRTVAKLRQDVLTVRDLANDVLQLSQSLELERPHLLGHSMGGTIAQYIGYSHPESVNKLCLVSTTFKWRKAALEAMQGSILLREKNIDMDIIIDCILPWLFGENFLLVASNLKNFKKLLLENPVPQSLEDQKRQFNVLKTFDSMSNLRNITADTLIIGGDEDLLSLPFESEALHKNIPNSKMVLMPCAHMQAIELPNEFVNLLIQFFKK